MFHVKHFRTWIDDGYFYRLRRILREKVPGVKYVLLQLIYDKNPVI